MKNSMFLNKFNSFINFLTDNLVDVIIFVAMVIIGINSSFINIHFGMYVLSTELIILAYVISGSKKQRR